MSPARVTGRIVIAGSRSKGASGEYLRALARKLSTRGHRVVLLYPGPPSDERDDILRNPGIAVWPSRRPTHVKDAIFLIRLIAKIRPTHLVANFASVNLLMTVGRAFGVPNRISWYRTLSKVIEIDRGKSVWRLRFQRFRKRLVYGVATHIVTNSLAGKEDVSAVFRVPLPKVTVFPNCIADPLPTGCEQGSIDRHRIVCAGRMDRVKGQDVLVRALLRVLDSHADAYVVFLGTGPLEAEHRSLAEQLGVAQRCRFLGVQPHMEVLRQLARGMVSVVPSRSEAFGYVNIESMAVGTPIVASRVGGIGEIIRDGVDGFLVPPDDSDALADRLSLILGNSALRAELSKNARRRFLERYEHNIVLDAQVSWIEGMLLPELKDRLTFLGATSPHQRARDNHLMAGV